MSDSKRLLDLVERWQVLHQQSPSLTPEELCADCPDLLDDLKRQVEELGEPAAEKPVLSPNSALDLATSTFPPRASGAAGDSTQAHDFDIASPSSRVSVPQEMPGYEILGELGHGGMGVVYQARQIGLKRLVALKMIRAGSRAGEADKRRFLVEAEAVARLQHPNIVQIYEIGAHAGQPYFVLEYVEGGTLAQQIKKTKLPPDQAAAIMVLLAKAVQAAHQRGIIHRDLKPANVLLTLDGAPKVTDFGLAKQLDADQALSQAGDIMGSPPYMAPEQAFGRIQDIGPGTDIYALGAILYELLTGRPPFQGASTLETLDMVRHEEPAPPRTLQSAIPRDLETICLKCLRKEPSQRYTSALALAQDLERFLAGEAILARREGMLAKVMRKVRRNRAASVLTMALVLAMTAAAVILYRSGHTSRVQEVIQRLEALRKGNDWPDAKVHEVEGLLEQLALLAPERVKEETDQFHDSLLDSGTKPLQQQSSLQPDHKFHTERMIGLLAQRDPVKATTLERRYQARLRLWETVFGPESPRKAQAELQRFGKDVRPSDMVQTKYLCQGNVRLEATWDAWEKTSQVGLVLHGEVDQGKTGYVFLLGSLPLPGAKDKDSLKPTFQEVRRDGGRVELQILRNGVALRKIDILAAELPAGALRVSAEREEDRLRFYLDQRMILETRDLVPLTPRGSYGIVWPEQATLKSLVAMRQALPASPGKLEHGDELFAKGQLVEAEEFYAKQAIELLGTPEGFEARFKEALSLQLLHQGENAARAYESLVKQSNGKEANKWIFLATFQLWVELLRKKDLIQADALLQKLMSIDPSEKKQELILYIPDDVRSVIRSAYRQDAGGLGNWRHNPDRLHNIRRLVQVETLLDDLDYHGWSQLALLRVLRMEGHLDEAIQTVEKWLKEMPLEETTFSTLFAAEYGWMVRERGTPSRALDAVNRRLLKESGGYRPAALGLLIERARLRAAMDEWSEAQHDIEEFLLIPSEQQKQHRHRSDAYLMLGLIRDVRNDRAGALAAWRQGKFTGNPNDPELRTSLGGGIGFVNVLMFDSLCQDLDEKRTEALTRNLLGDFPGFDTALARFDAQSLFRSATAVMNRMWQTPKGKVAARKMVLQTCSFQEYVRLPIQAFAGEMVRAEAFADNMTVEQEDLVWKLSEDAFAAYTAGKMKSAQLFELAFIWKRGPLPFFGIATLKNLDPSLRGPMAYFVGLRFQRLGLPADEVLGIALQNAADNSPLQRLVRVELEKLKNKAKR